MSLSNTPEAEPSLYVVQYGLNHGPVNIQGVERVIDAVADAFERTQGKRVLYDETFGVSEEKGRSIRRMVKYNGFVFYAASQMVGSINEQKVRARMRQFQVPDQQLVDRRIIEPNNVLQFFKLRGLERLRTGTQAGTGLNFDYVIESHRNSLPKLIQERAATISVFMTGWTQWNDGRFDSAIDTHKRQFRDKVRSQENREPRMHNQLEDIVADMQKVPEGGALFINVGFTHRSFLERLKQFRFRPGISPVFESHIAVPEDIPELIIDQALRQRKPVDDIFYARDMFVNRGIEQLANDCIRRGKLYVFGKNFETITEAAVAIANSLSVDQIRTFCEQKQAFGTFVRQFPTGEEIHSILR